MNKDRKLSIKTLAQIAALTAIATAALAARADGPPLLSNGDFEQYGGSFDSDGRAFLQPTDSLAGWTVGGLGVALVNTPGLVLSGISMDLLGRDGSGSISQTFMAQAGTTYQLDWAQGGGNLGAQLTVGFADQTSSYYIIQGARSQQSLQWTATSSGLQTVSFARASGKDDVIVDGIQLSAVSAVPEPEPYALLLAGLGAVGFVARRRGGVR